MTSCTFPTQSDCKFSQQSKTSELSVRLILLQSGSAAQQTYRQTGRHASFPATLHPPSPPAATKTSLQFEWRTDPAIKERQEPWCTPKTDSNNARCGSVHSVSGVVLHGQVSRMHARHQKHWCNPRTIARSWKRRTYEGCVNLKDAATRSKPGLDAQRRPVCLRSQSDRSGYIQKTKVSGERCLKNPIRVQVNWWLTLVMWV